MRVELKISDLKDLLMVLTYREWKALKDHPNFDKMSVKEARDYLNKRGYVL